MQRRAEFCIALSLLVTACGGGGDPGAPTSTSTTAEPVQAPTVIATTTPAKVFAGTPATVSWSSTGASECLASGAWSGVRARAGTQNVALNQRGTYEYTITCTGPGGTASATSALEVTDTRTYQEGSRLYFETHDGQDVRRVGLETAWGSSIVEVSINGTNLVNAHDPGREIQLSLYDGNHRYSNPREWGWNPIEGGDLYNHGNPTLAYELHSDSLYAKAQGIEWAPDDKGGGPNKAVASDVYFEKWISRVAGHPAAFRVRYRITHFGTDSHSGTRQELPAVYTNAEFGTLSHFSGQAPFAGNPLTTATDPSCKVSGGTVQSAEQWASFSDGVDQGLTVFVPDAYPYFVACHLLDDGSAGPTGNSTNYLQPVVARGFGPGEVFESEFFVMVGNPAAARVAVYDFQDAIPLQDALSPFGVLDEPALNSSIRGITTVRGWLLDNVEVVGVEVLVDDSFAGMATLGVPRPDVAKVFPLSGPRLGFTFALDTTRYATGSHVVKVRAVDAAGNTAEYSASVRIVR